MKLSILVTSLLSLGASALPEAEESITVGEYTYTGGDLPKGELKVSIVPSTALSLNPHFESESDLHCRMYSPCVTWKNDAAAHLGLARGGEVFANLAVANAGAIMAAILAMADGTGASQVVTAYASNNMQMDSGKTLIATTTLRAVTVRRRRPGSRPGTLDRRGQGPRDAEDS
ncbi:hypothetical protein E4U27_001917 [Claviceps purpurea]|nr:hypothetical protein E4U27_001917 [Claviceps purpurea]